MAASKFAEDTNMTAIYVKELVENGYFEADDEDGNVYGLDKDLKKININCYVILTEQKKGIYYSDFIDNDYMNEDGTCDYNIPNKLTNGFKIEMYDALDNNKISYDSGKKWWTKNDVILKAIIPEDAKPIKKIEWYEGYNNIPLEDNGENLTVTTTSVLQQNYTAKVTDKEGNILTARVRIYIDKIAPNFYGSDAKNVNDKWEKNEINYSVKAYDNESDLYGYKEIGKNETCPTTKSSYQKDKNISFESNGTKNICVIDNVGNTSKKYFDITHIDNLAPRCIWKVYTNNNEEKDFMNLSWTNNTRRIELTCQDTSATELSGQSGCTSDSKKTWIINSGTTNDSNNYIFTIKDNVGNKTDCTKIINLKVDKEGPTCVSSGGSSNWTNSNVTITGTCTGDSGVGCGNQTTVSKTYKNETNLTNQSPGIIYDKLGNSTVCPSDQTIKIDKTPPVGSWSVKNNKVTLTCSDTGSYQSGIKSGTYTWTLTSSPVTLSNKCVDNAGNVSNNSKVAKYVQTDCKTRSQCHCSAYKSCQNASCGCESYNSCSSAGCASYGTSTCTVLTTAQNCNALNGGHGGGGTTGTINGGNMVCNYPCSKCTSYNRSPVCGCASYNSCQNAACGCESYYAADDCSCEEWNYAWQFVLN